MQNESDVDLQPGSENISTTSLDSTAFYRSPVPSTFKDVHSPEPVQGSSPQGSPVPSTSKDVHSPEPIQGLSAQESTVPSTSEDVH